MISSSGTLQILFLPSHWLHSLLAHTCKYIYTYMHACIHTYIYTHIYISLCKGCLGEKRERARKAKYLDNQSPEWKYCWRIYTIQVSLNLRYTWTSSFGCYKSSYHTCKECQPQIWKCKYDESRHKPDPYSKPVNTYIHKSRWLFKINNSKGKWMWKMKTFLLSGQHHVGGDHKLYTSYIFNSKIDEEPKETNNNSNKKAQYPFH